MKLTNVHYLYRIGRKAYRHGHKKAAGLIRLYMRIVCTCDIPFQADIDDSVHFNHNGFGIVINPSCKIGYSTDIQHNVTLGELRGGGDAPIIGNNVYIGAKAVILGKITIGDNAKIGAGSIVLSDVPPNVTVVGNPAKIVKINKPNE